MESLFKFLQKLSEMREPQRRLTCRNASGSGLMSKTKPSKRSTTLLKNHKYSNTQSGPIEGQRDASKDGLVSLLIHRGQPVISRHSRWQRGSIPRSRSNFWSQFLAWSVTTNMCSVSHSADWSKSPCLYYAEATGINTQDTKVSSRKFSSMTTKYATSLGKACF